MISKYIGPKVLEMFGTSIEDFFAGGNRYNFYLQPVTKIHLDPTVEHSVKPASDPKYLWIFSSIAVLIIVIASINFMNLSTAQATKRAKEVGIKKATGSSRWNLIRPRYRTRASCRSSGRITTPRNSIARGRISARSIEP